MADKDSTALVRLTDEDKLRIESRFSRYGFRPVRWQRLDKKCSADIEYFYAYFDRPEEPHDVPVGRRVIVLSDERMADVVTKAAT